MKIARRKPPEPHIPFISLADIAWQIIIFFLVASQFANNEALKIDVPASNETTAPSDKKTLTVAASAETILLDGTAVTLDALQAELAEKLKGKTSDQDRAVLVEAHDDLPFQRDVEIMFAIQQAGGILVMSEGAK